jgi:hypothetical protein
MTASKPTTGEIVRELEMLLPPMTNYAESVCAEGAFAHSTYMVWDDPEPYIIKNGIDRLKSQEQTIAALTARAEKAEREWDALMSSIERLRTKKIELCSICEFEDLIACCHKNHCEGYQLFKRRGLSQEGEGKENG